MKKRLVGSILLLFITLGVFTTAVAAWFTPSAQYINNIIFTAGTIEVDATLYEASDFDRDGVLDIVEGTNVYTAKNDITILSMKPGEVYCYKLDITNIGELKGDLEVYFEGATESLKEVLTFSSVIFGAEGEKIADAGADRAMLATENMLASVANLAQDAQVSVLFKSNSRPWHN